MKRDLVKIKEALAMHCYLTETVFSRIEEKRTCSVHLESVDLIIVLPDRKKLGGALLDSCYAKVKSVVDNHTEEMKLNACLTSDVWSNIKNEPIVNYMLISDSSAFFLESVSTGKQSHNAKWIAQDMGRIIDSLAGKIKAQLQKAQLTENLPGLVQPAPTRWSSLKTCFESLRKSEHVLHRIVSAKDFIQGTGKQKESQQKIHDIITDETEQSQQMGKKEEMYLQYTNFVIKANHNKDRKDVSLPDVGKGGPRLSCSSGWLMVLNFLSWRDLALQVFGFDNQNVKDWVDTETESESEVERD
ncbi:hypothetical protein BASA50_002124 [Batrachochytrium salamandrivorans]|uniref:DUF659 domain-containing protein n=1 Tax=Batrachochytrium salamandrivorans TaxID=1357716 RepID=A0ABQ8FN82_9FUNG|nr:hypothetical protein BASA60_008150 [Batrachochytrium salamandrivorans]KAH6600560.1 hypothetical protein BASA50_002124 [Batrachochytrium salamandrivorans]